MEALHQRFLLIANDDQKRAVSEARLQAVTCAEKAEQIAAEVRKSLEARTHEQPITEKTPFLFAESHGNKAAIKKQGSFIGENKAAIKKQGFFLEPETSPATSASFNAKYLDKRTASKPQASAIRKQDFFLVPESSR